MSDVYLIIIPSFKLKEPPIIEINKFRESFYKFHRFNWVFLYEDISKKTEIFHVNFIESNFMVNKTTTIGYNYIFKDWTRNLHGYQINVSYFTDRQKSHFNYSTHKIGGLEAAFLYTICKTINSTCTIVNDPSTQLDLSTVRDLFTNHSAVINFNIQPSMEEEYLDLKGIAFLYPRRFDSLCVWVPKLKYDPSVLILFPFTINFGYLLLFLTVFSGILWYGLMLKTNSPRQLSAIFFTLLQYQMLQSTCMKFQNRFERILFMAFGFLSLILVTCYQKLLSVQLIVPVFQPVINTISELNSSNLCIISENKHFIEVLKQAYQNDSFLDRITISESSINDWILFTYPNTATFDFKSNTQRNLELFENFSNISLHIMNECLYSTPESYPMQSYFAFRNRFNFLITAITESGIERRWDSYFLQLQKTDFLLAFTEFRKGLYTKNEINLSHMKVVFIFCICCWIISIIIFIFELFYGKCQIC